MLKKAWGKMLYINRYIFVFIMGLLIGTILLNFYFRDKHSELLVYGRYIFGSINNIGVDKLDLLLSIIIRRFKELAIIILLAYTIFGEIYTYIYVLGKGLLLGLALSLAVYCYGIKGVLVVFLMTIGYIIPYVLMVYFVVDIALSIFKRRAVDIKYILGLVFAVITEILLECFV